MQAMTLAKEAIPCEIPIFSNFLAIGIHTSANITAKASGTKNNSARTSPLIRKNTPKIRSANGSSIFLKFILAPFRGIGFGLQQCQLMLLKTDLDLRDAFIQRLMLKD